MPPRSPAATRNAASGRSGRMDAAGATRSRAFAARRVVSTVGHGRRPWGLAMTPDGAKLYSANGLSNDVSVVDTKSRRVVRTIRVGEGPWGVAIR